MPWKCSARIFRGAELATSVIIPAFNAEATIAETLDSLQAQSILPEEIILVDDGSRDRTVEIASSHPSAPKVLRQANSGAAAASNTGVERAQADWVAFLDADDLASPERFALQQKALIKADEGAIILGQVQPFLCPSVDPQRAAHLQIGLDRTDGWLPGCMMMRREDFLRLGGFDTTFRHGHFVDFAGRARADGFHFVMLDKIVLHRRIRPNTLGARTRDKNDPLTQDFLAIARKAILRKRAVQSGR